MQARQLFIIALLAAAAIAAALLLNAHRTPSEPAGERLFPNLESQLNSISEMRIIDAEGETAVTLDRTERDWVVVEKDGFPADRAQLRKILLELANATIVEEKTSKPEFYSRLGIEDPGSPDAGSIGLEIDGVTDPLRLIVGKIAFDGYGTYVRLMDDPRGLLISGELEPDADPLSWVRRELIDIAAADVAAVTIEHADGERLRIEKSARTDSNFVVTDVPEGRSLSSEYAPNSIGSALAALGFDDVRARIDPGPAVEVTTTRYEMFDGRIVELEIFDHEDNTWTNFDFGYDDALADRFGIPAANDDDAPDTGSAAPDASDQPGAGPDLQLQTTELSDRLGAWSFVITEYKRDQMRKRTEDLLAPPAPAEDGE